MSTSVERRGWRAALLDWRTWVASAISACAASGYVSGAAGAYGMALGLFATTFSILALWGVVRLLGDWCRDRPPSTAMQFVLILAFLFKFPLLWAAWVVATRIGDMAPSCFLMGLGLVYSALVGWVLAQS
ncbi:MAG: hypothetical protein AMXMBFR81_16730 [Chthonomonas sp.]